MEEGVCKGVGLRGKERHRQGLAECMPATDAGNPREIEDRPVRVRSVRADIQTHEYAQVYVGGSGRRRGRGTRGSSPAACSRFCCRGTRVAVEQPACSQHESVCFHVHICLGACARERSEGEGKGSVRNGYTVTLQARTSGNVGDQGRIDERCKGTMENGE